MSGHSKWSKVKHQKATTDAVKGQAFTKASRAITIAVREGGGIADPGANFKLRLAIEKAKEVNVPKENIKRAIDRASGAENRELAEVLYEGFGPSGVALLIEAVTDNRQRTVSAIKNILDRSGGTIANPGAVSYQFRHVGVMTLAKEGKGIDEILTYAIEAGADEVFEKEDVYEVYTPLPTFSEVKEKLEVLGLRIETAHLVYIPTTHLTVTAEKARSVEGLVAELAELDDVQTVFTNVA